MAWPSNEVEVKADPATVRDTPEWLKDRDLKITEWLANKRLLEAAKEAEMNSRKALTDKVFEGPKRGTNRYFLSGGYALKFLHGLNYTLYKEDVLDADGEKIDRRKLVESLEDRIDALGEAAQVLCSRLIKWTPSLVDSEYRKLDLENGTECDVKALIDEVLTVEPASPQLSFEEPKGAK
jgi:hypothetical protein